MVINHKGRACTQRVDPKMALIEVELPNEAFEEGFEPTKNSFMLLKAPGMDVLKVGLTKPRQVSHGVSVWGWSGSALDEGDEVSTWLSDFLGKPCRLVRFNDDSEIRHVDPKYAEGHKIMFSDEYPFLLLSQASLDALNQLLKEPVPVNRFRPNILVEGCEPFSEDLWTEMKIKDSSFQGVKLCSRCKVPSIDQERGIPGSEPGETLRKFRSDNTLRPTHKQQGRVYFGQNLIWNWKDIVIQRGRSTVSVGDPVFVLKKVSSAAEAAA